MRDLRGERSHNGPIERMSRRPAAWHDGEKLPDCPTIPTRAQPGGNFEQCPRVLHTAQHLAANVMLRSLWYLGKASSCRPASPLPHLFNHQTSLKSISTNTAINRSLRRSQHQNARPERRLSGRDENSSDGFLERKPPRERNRRPNHQQGHDIEDMEEFTRSKERYKALRQAKLSRNLRPPRASRHKQDSSSNRASRGSSHNYAPNPGGNRATRRARQFGHTLENPGLDASNASIRKQIVHRRSVREDVTSSVEPVRVSSALRRRAVREQKKGDDHNFSMPDRQQDDSQSFHALRQQTFTMERRGYMSNSTSTKSFRHDPLRSSPFQRHEADRLRNDRESSRHQQSAPLSIPYTTPASEFLYGTSVVTSALLASRRKLYKLYIYDGDNREVREQDKRIRRLALDRGVVVERVKGDWLRLMDRTSMGRPHNGYILEASPLPKLPVLGFRSVDTRQGDLHVLLDYQSREDEAINGTGTQIIYETEFPRYPLILLLDGILDPGNLGGILRTAFFLGVDAVAISSRSSAPLSPVALKASAGASESLPIVSVDQPGKFIQKCQSFGWKICAAVAPRSGKTSGRGRYISTSTLQSPVRDHPCVLILGGEGEGLRWDIQSKADFTIGIDGRRVGQGKVDSLNVSVAAGLLCEAFLRKPVMSEKTAVGPSFDSTSDVAGLDHSGDFEVDNRIF